NLFIQRVSRGGGSGREYRRGSRRRHRASAPGEYPATDTGRLVNSIAYQMHGPREGAIFSDLEYAGYLADGTSRMDPRKMLRDALQEVLDNDPNPGPLAGAVRLK